MQLDDDLQYLDETRQSKYVGGASLDSTLH